MSGTFYSAHGQEEGSDEEYCCPICFHHPDDSHKLVIGGNCKHPVCQGCMERLLVASSSRGNNLSNYESATDEEMLKDQIASLPTRGRCPICKASLDLFDIQYFMMEHHDTISLYHKEYNLSNSPLRGCVISVDESYNNTTSHAWPFYIENLVFPEDDSSLPYVEFKENYSTSSDDNAPLRRYFQPKCFYNDHTHTFHGTVIFGSLLQEATGEFILQFTDDLKYICQGGIILSQMKHQHHPLDGMWTVTWYPSAASATIRVAAGRFSLYGFTYHIGQHEEASSNTYFFSWPRSVPEVTQTLLLTSETGLNIGDTITWTTNHPNYQRIQWTLLSPFVSFPEVIPMFPPGGCLYANETCLLNDQATINTSYTKNSLWGNTFVQLSTVGLASYHFENINGTEPSAYISYSHPEAFLSWPPLDNGRPIPSKMYFTNITYIESSKTFCGVIDWFGTHQTTWQGCFRWRYEMVFDTAFVCILRGHVWSYNNNSTVEEDYGKLDHFGQDLVYINADAKGCLLASRDESNAENEVKRVAAEEYRTMWVNERERLLAEGASYATMTAFNHQCSTFYFG